MGFAFLCLIPSLPARRPVAGGSVPARQPQPRPRRNGELHCPRASVRSAARGRHQATDQRSDQAFPRCSSP